MFRTLAIFVLGVYVGQEYGDVIPNVKSKTEEFYDKFTETEFYKKLKSDLK
jgi:hypothetical protein